MTPPTEFEQRITDAVLRRLRKVATAVNRRAYTGEEVMRFLEREAYAQERAGSQEAADALDAAGRMILALLIERAQTRKFEGSGGRRATPRG